MMIHTMSVAGRGVGVGIQGVGTGTQVPSGHYPLSLNRMTDTRENITFPQLRLWA